MKIKDLHITVDSESVNIYVEKGDDIDPIHIIYWTEDEWLEDPKTVVPAILIALELYYEGQHELLLRTIGLGKLIDTETVELIKTN